MCMCVCVCVCLYMCVCVCVSFITCIGIYGLGDMKQIDTHTYIHTHTQYCGYAILVTYNNYKYRCTGIR